MGKQREGEFMVIKTHLEFASENQTNPLLPLKASGSHNR